MSKSLTDEKLKELIDKSTDKLNTFIKELTEENNNKQNKKRAMLLAYWIIDYIRMLKAEKTFDSKKLLKYKRGDIILIDLGFRIGNEFGGRHFAVVIDNFNSKKSGIISVVPLTSKKEKDYNSLYCYELKTGLHELHKQKLDFVVENCKEALKGITEDNVKCRQNPNQEAIDDIAIRLKNIHKKIDEAYDLKSETDKLKDGTVVNIGQIITVSKIRIINPKQASDSLKGIRLSTEDLDAINEKIKNLFIYKEADKTTLEFINGIKSQN